MPHFAPDLLARWTAGRWSGEAAGPLCGFSTDSRTLRPGEAFVALKTEKRDGHAFLREARQAGAGAAIVSEGDPSVPLPQLVVADPLAAFQAIAREHRRGFTGPVIGITGSAGKTSTKDLLARLLEAGGADPSVLATEENLNNHLGVPLTLTKIDPSRHRFAVVEAGISGPAEMAALASMIEPSIAVTTLIAPAHLSGLGSLEQIAAEKAALSRAVRPGGWSIFPSSCRSFAGFQGLPGRTLALDRVALLSGPARRPDRLAFTVAHSPGATALALGDERAAGVTFTLVRVSDGMAQNAALALAAALRLGVAPERLRERLLRWRPARWRGQVLIQDGTMLYLDCYNANPASMADALEAFRSMAPAGQRKVYLLGCMEELGPDSRRLHRELGKSLRLDANDRAIVVGDQAADVKEGAVEAGAFPGQVDLAAPDAVDLAGRIREPGPCAVFVKGSRRYRLERAVAALAPPQEAHA